MKEKTALQTLIDRLTNLKDEKEKRINRFLPDTEVFNVYKGVILAYQIAIDEAKELIELEKKQVINAYKHGTNNQYVFEHLDIERISAENYFTDTYEQPPSKKEVCSVCGSEDIIEVPHMGKNCNSCHPL